MIRPRRRRLVPAAAVAAVLALGTTAGAAWAAFVAVTANGPSTFSVVADTAAPALARATVAPEGGSADVVRQGAGYHVYAEATDDVSGVAQVRADTSAFDAGATIVTLSTEGGPWTAGGETYAYRSPLLTADSPLAPGPRTYTVRATDRAGNPRERTFSATVESYAQVVAATPGLVAHWRLGEATVGDDAFSGAAGTKLQSHTGAVGATWTHMPGTDEAVITAGGRIRTTDGTARYWASGAPPTADYTVEADVYGASVSAGDAAGVLGRVDTASAGGTWYAAAYDVNAGRWLLTRRVAGATATLGSSTSRSLSTGVTRRVSLDMRATTIRLLVDGVELVSVTDAAIPAAGRAGVWTGGSGGSGSGLLGGILGTLGGMVGGGANPDDATLQIDDFRVAPRAADAAGANAGAYLRGPALGAAGALAGDPSTAAAFDGANDFAEIPDAAALDLADGPFTLEAWVKRSTISTARQTLLAKGAGSFHWVLEGGRVALLKDGGAAIATSTATLTDTIAFHHLAVVRGTGGTRLYLDGADVTGPVAADVLADTANPLLLGGGPAGATPLAGVLDEVAVYRAELTAAEIRDHHRAGAGSG